ncbi:tyrosine-protein phosphatase [Bifidobacterium choloepi]|uniref:Tyrosine-protein phosphatase n=1 Tax=Bifidobacterium choloepi TaxID=2614131 RepID=A0A6I5N1F7_9BIFI|nr:tyrosine-protein phosphatase [Bifidobacterium choloepi]NEG70447.1 tyrosine-protein phosphatase [Bifidobacterium choloepi]
MDEANRRNEGAAAAQPWTTAQLPAAKERRQLTVSRSLDLQSVENCRDLGGILTKDGRVVRAGNLIRSAALHRASGKDLETLNNLGLKTVIDLRMKGEREAARDRLLVGWNIVKQPVFTENGRTKLAQLKGILVNPGTYILRLYPTMLTTPRAVDCWKHMFRSLIDQPGGYLWHCTQGKDRTGVAAALVLASLGVDDETIKADYLETNEYMPQEVPKSVVRMERFLGWRADMDIDQFLEARPANFEALQRTVAQYGGFQGYLSEVVGLDDSDFSVLRDFYTVDRHSARFTATERDGILTNRTPDGLLRG